MYSKIIVAVDAAAIDKADRIVPRAVKLLREGGSIVLVSVVEDLPGYVLAEVPVGISLDARREAEARIEDLRRRHGLAATIEVRQGAPARELLTAAAEHDADLIILASHKPDFSNYFLGATADRIVRHAQCSVLVDR
ncbi:universal stress protein [Pseudorhizobium endolithicum]|uniref:Universal stress protein n=1 Tax=Pseudorhizobium endolithicum TaxID=1191678 RepID=A0ABM8PG64_9HYPH|nr:universal stress protein [Pseudorhizobium endolithicum]CAD7027861.1 universal stress protein [Pseudorhizobium endolithicum]